MPTQKIMSRFDGRVLYECEAQSLLEAVQRAIKSGADLSGANMSGADLSGANMSGADLSGADLYRANMSEAYLSGANMSGADLSGADLYRANMSGADLSGADLYRADLSGAKINWQSHDMIAEILRRAAGNEIAKREVAGLILVSRDWCWDKFLAIDDARKTWALAELSKWVRDGDNAPEVLRAMAKAAQPGDGEATERSE